MLTIKNLRDQKLILFEALSGSKAYGLDLPGSDTDIRGVYISPKKNFYGLNVQAQVNDEKQDVVFYELKRFFELLSKSNPSLLELLSVSSEDIIYKHPLFDLLDPQLLLSKKCKDAFAGYAFTQIKKAKGLNKKIYNPVDKERKSILHFCYVINGKSSRPLLEWLAENDYKQENCGLAKINHMKDLYGLYYQEDQDLGFKGVMHKDNANEVALSSIPKELQPKTFLSFNKEGYCAYCKDYRSYWDWVEKRNEERYKNTIQHGKNYDAKNMMHTFRLLEMAIEIMRFEKVIVKRPDREELLKIRSGHYHFDELISKAEEKMEAVNYWYERSSLPEEPDKNRMEEVLFQIREEWYLSAK